MTDKKTLIQRLRNYSGLYCEVQSYLSSLDTKYGLKNFNYSNIISYHNPVFGDGNNGNVYLFLLEKFALFLEDAVDTSKYSDEILLDLLKMVKVVYDIQFTNISVMSSGHTKIHDLNKVRHYITDITDPVKVKEGEKEYHDMVSNFIKECNKMLFTIILDFKNKSV